jgi:hypothetical protein
MRCPSKILIALFQESNEPVMVTYDSRADGNFIINDDWSRADMFILGW